MPHTGRKVATSRRLRGTRLVLGGTPPATPSWPRSTLAGDGCPDDVGPAAAGYPRERPPPGDGIYSRASGWAIFLLALALRVCVAVGIALVHPQNIAPDGVEYSALAAAKASGHTAGWGSYEHFLWHVTLTLLLPLTWLYEVFGIHQLVGQLYVALLGAGTAAVTTPACHGGASQALELGRRSDRRALPTQIVWSSLILKDSSVWFLLTCLALTVAVAGRSSGPRLIALGLAAAALLVLLGYLREYTLVIAAWALMLAVLVGPRTHRLPQIAGAVVIAVFIPWAVSGIGPAGPTYVKGSPRPAIYVPAWLSTRAAQFRAPRVPAAGPEPTSVTSRRA